MARYDENNNPYSWMPGFLRRFLNLTYDEPQSGSASYAPATPSVARSSWSAPSEPTFKATSMDGYTPPAGSYAPQAMAGYAPPPPAAAAAEGAPASAAPNLTAQGYIKPFIYLLPAFARGAMPPQGLEEFSKLLRTTSTDVWNLYSHWFRFQTEDIFRFGRGVLDAAIENLPASSAPVTSRRIKVTVANGNDNGNGHAAEDAGPAAS